MAFASDSTPTPTRRLSRTACPCRVLTTEDLLDKIDREIRRQKALVRCSRPRPQVQVRCVQLKPAPQLRARIRS